LTPPACQASRIVDGKKGKIAAMYPDFVQAHARGP